MSKRVLNIFTVLLIFFSALLIYPLTAWGNPGVTIELNGQPVEGDVNPYIDENSRTMVPVRFISEAVGGEVGWDGEKRKVKISRGSSVVELFIDEKLALVNGEEKEMDTVAVIKDGRTMVPLRFLSETFGMDVEWIAKTRTVALTKLIAPDVPRDGSARVTGSSVNIRPGPGTDSLPVITRVSKGDELTLLGQTGDWYQVRLPAEKGEKIGWIAGWLVELQEKTPEPEEPDPGEKEIDEKEEEEKEQPLPVPFGDLEKISSSSTALVMKESVNIRASSSLDSPIIDRVTYGDWLEVIGERDNWYQVRLGDGRNGWIAGWLVATRYEPPGGSSNPALAAGTEGPLFGSWSDSVMPGNPDGENNEENSTKDLPVITDIEIFEAETGVKLRITANSSLPLPKIVRVTDPSRMAFDFSGLLAGENSDNITPIEVNSNPVVRIRAAQYEKETVRIVADLQENIVHSVARKNDGSTVEIVLKPAFPLEKTVVIDPGHGTRNNWGSTDPGAIGPSGVAERDVVTNISYRLGEILLEKGYSVVFTREMDTGITLLERSKIANQSGGVFVSVHANAHPNREKAGTMTFYPGTRGGGSEEFISTSKEMASYVQDELLALLKRPDKGVRQANFSVLRNTHIPTILVEVAFMSNPEEEKLLAQDDFQNQAALAIARGIQRYMEAHKR